MSFGNFPYESGMRNMQGMNRFYFLPKEDVTAIPQSTNNIISNDITTTNDWYEGYFSFETEDFTYNEEITSNGKIYNISLKGKLPKLSPSAENLFFLKSNKEFVLLVFDNNNQGRVCGNTKKGMRFTFSTNTVTDGYTFEYFGTFGSPQPFYTGAYNSYVPPNPYANLPISYKYFMPNGYTTIVKVGDFAWQEANIWIAAREAQQIVSQQPILDDFFTLNAATPNVFGNTSRFTDKLGNALPNTNPTETYVVDNYTGLGWFAYDLSTYSVSQYFDDIYAVASVSNAAGYNDWLVPSRPTWNDILNDANQTIDHLGYSYISFALGSHIPIYGDYYTVSSSFFFGLENVNPGPVIMFRKHF